MHANSDTPPLQNVYKGVIIRCLPRTCLTTGDTSRRSTIGAATEALGTSPRQSFIVAMTCSQTESSTCALLLSKSFDFARDPTYSIDVVKGVLDLALVHRVVERSIGSRTSSGCS